MSIDFKQFYQVFFEESYEGLDIMEQGLLEISKVGITDSELINTIFRAAHSIKGGSATLGFSEMVSFTHVLETLLDEVREGNRELTAEAIDLLLQSCDALREMVRSLEQEQPIDTTTSQPLLVAFEELLTDHVAPTDGETTADVGALSNQANALEETFFGSDGAMLSTDRDAEINTETDSDIATDSAAACGRWLIDFKPQPQILLTGNEPLRIFRELETLGDLTVIADVTGVPEFDQLTVDECFISWRLLLASEADHDTIQEVFDWVLDECQLEIRRVNDVEAAAVQAPQPSQSAVTDVAEVIAAEEEPTEQLVGEVALAQVTAPVAASSAKDKTGSPSAPTKTPATPVKAEPTKGDAVAMTGGGSGPSIRVGIDKVDNLINLVGELVITQSMLSELGNNFDMEKLERLANGLEQLKQNTRELQESVMRIRMLPISFTFNRFPRMIRDLSIKTGKQVDLILSGEQTELDKTVMEQIGDPLVHLVRNAVDHGLELPDERLAAGKPETGSIRLNAEHKGGNIVIEITDDGRGLDPEKILNKAREKGIVAADQELSDAEIYELIFEPGFSTAAEVSDLSGRGVGMDVVRRNIKSLGGRIEIESHLGQGSTFRVHLPLTLAILDGQLVRVGREVFVIPLVAIVESLQIKTDLVNRVSGNMVLYRLRDDNVPIIPVYREFNIQADNTELENALLVVVEGDGCKIGLLVDDLLAQQQVVIKSLESNYKRVDGISGATILGDGSVALILDIPGLIKNAARPRKRVHSSRAA
ncbi:chemotaxis protein CheA [Halioxenophilus sp. WMMB6]|uniref:chemotaxis protein CheA n=1 Tax=Halioxenophilus sp. WMMB6 TaxID=3073815 RepID=UPI00295EE411|nr:chemotaxis protein CheA [Halioxenophilus sp. WMMB6]